MAIPLLARCAEFQGLSIVTELNIRKRQPIGFDFLAERFPQALCEFLVIKRGLSRSLLRIHEDKLLPAASEVVLIPEPGVLREPMRCHLRFVHPFDSPTKASEAATPLLSRGR